MGYQVVKGGVLTDAANIEVVKNGVLTQVKTVEVVDGGVLKTVWLSAILDLSGIPASIIAFNFGASAISGYYIDSNSGHRQRQNANYTAISPNWLSGSATVGNDYEVRMVRNSGSTPTGTLNTWLSMGSNRSWTLTRPSVGVNVCNLTVSIRDKATDTIQDTRTFNLESEYGT